METVGSRVQGVMALQVIVDRSKALKLTCRDSSKEMVVGMKYQGDIVKGTFPIEMLVPDVNDLEATKTGCAERSVQISYNRKCPGMVSIEDR